DGSDSSVTSVAFHDEFVWTPNTAASAIAAPQPKGHIEDHNVIANHRDGSPVAHPLLTDDAAFVTKEVLSQRGGGGRSCSAAALTASHAIDRSALWLG